MKRREFTAGLGAVSALWPLAVRAQQAATPVIGILHQSTLNNSRRPMIDEFKRGLSEFGYIETRNLVIEYRWAEDHYDRLPALAADLVRKQVSVIVTFGGTPAAVAAKAATQTIPIVFQIGANPLEYDLVASLARPGGNVTGFTMIANEVIAKRLDLLHQLVPTASSIAFLFNPANLSNEAEEVQTAARIVGVRVLMKGAVRPSDIESVFGEMARERVGALIVSADSLFFANVDRVAAMAIRQGLPALFVNREAVSAGGLMSYGTSLPDLYRQVGAYAGRIIKGEKPADLPVQQPTKFDLTINLKTARSLGLTIPETLLAIADEMIQ